MQNDKSPGDNGLTKEFYETFWNELNEIFIDSVLEAKEKGHLSISKKQAIITLIEKNDRDKRFIKNWRPISFRETKKSFTTFNIFTTNCVC